MAGPITTAIAIGIVGKVESPEHPFRAFSCVAHIEAAVFSSQRRRIKKAAKGEWRALEGRGAR
jgi:hypothetical protein